jgi:condensin complex subunit 3
MAPKPKHNPENLIENLHEWIGAIFDQAQLSLANHKKNCVALYKIHTQVVVRAGRDGSVSLVGERAFQDVFIEMVSRVLGVKKGAGTAGAERIVKYVGAFVRFMNEKGECFVYVYRNTDI